MPWKTKLLSTDYEYVIFQGMPRIQDRRNRKAFVIPPHVIQTVAAKHLFRATPQHVIEHCIAIALIPHPYEEYE